MTMKHQHDAHCLGVEGRATRVESLSSGVPTGPVTIAQQFTAGTGMGCKPSSSPEGTTESRPATERESTLSGSVVPPGLFARAGALHHPAMNRWAILDRPFGTLAPAATRRRGSRVKGPGLNLLDDVTPAAALPRLPSTVYRLPPASRRGITLIELLVVVLIIALISAVAIPVMIPALEGRRAREAARAVNVFFSSARTRAMATGRPVGVMIHRQPGRPQAALSLSYVKVPPMWAGDTLDSRVVIQIVDDPAIQNLKHILAQMPECRERFIRVGDQLQLGSQGAFYRILGPDDVTEGPSGSSEPDGYIDRGTTFPDPPDPWIIIRDDLEIDPKRPADRKLTLQKWVELRNFRRPESMQEAAFETILSLPPYANYGMTYQVFRQPHPSAAGGMQMPGSLVLDLEASGVGSETFFSPPPAEPESSIIVLFAANGAVDRVWYSGTGAGQPVTENIFLLIGQSDRVPVSTGQSAFGLPFNANDEAELPNWADLGNLWITINAQSGLVATYENAGIDAASLNTLSTAGQETQRRDAIHAARAFTRSGQNLGGR